MPPLTWNRASAREKNCAVRKKRSAVGSVAQRLSLASHDVPGIIGLDPQGLVRRLPKALEILLGQGACFLEQSCLGVDGISRPLNRMVHKRSELGRIREVLRFKLLEASVSAQRL